MTEDVALTNLTPVSSLLTQKAMSRRYRTGGPKGKCRATMNLMPD